jgi:tRNA threonylcarbamoyladenosine biosynthesis protein TsaB
MLTLGVDTSGALGSVALYGDGLAIARTMEAPLSHAERLFSLVEEILRDSRTQKAKVGLVSVNRGPGSFTGLRIGLAAAKGLCQSLRIPLTGVDAMLLHRERVKEASRVCVAISGRRDLFYVRWFGTRYPEGSTQVLQEAELISRCSALRSQTVVVGRGTDRLDRAVRAMPSIQVLPEMPEEEFALAIAAWGMENFATDQLYTVEPLYVEPLLIGGAPV